MTLYNTIENLCKEKKISIYALEKTLDLSKGSVSKWQNSMPTADKIIKLATYFNISTDNLLGIPEINPPFIHFRTAYKNKILVFDNSGDKYEFDFNKDQLKQVLNICDALTKE